MRVIITGGTGLIGRKLAERLGGDGYEVVVLSRNPGRVTNLPANTRAVKWDTHSAEGWGELADGAKAIINLAGESVAGTGILPDRWTDEKRKRIMQSRLKAGQAVSEAVSQATTKPEVVLQASAVGYYGVSLEGRFDESSPAGNDFLAQVCQAWEPSTADVEKEGVRHVIMRIGLVLSMEGGAFARLVTPYKLFVGGPFGNGKQWWSWIHIDDLVSAMHFLIEKEHAKGIYNLSAPHPLTNNDFGKTLGRVLKRPHLIPVPRFAFQAAFGEAATIVMDGQHAVPKRLPEAGYTFQFPQAESAFRDLLK